MLMPQATHAGVFTDQLVEALYDQTINGLLDDQYDKNLHTIVQRYIITGAPILLASRMQPHDGSALVYVSAISLEFIVSNCRGPNWPGTFKWAEDCNYAVSIAYPHMHRPQGFVHPQSGQAQWSDYAPGKTINRACLAALIQLAREYADLCHNRGQYAVN